MFSTSKPALVRCRGHVIRVMTAFGRGWDGWMDGSMGQWIGLIAIKTLDTIG